MEERRREAYLFLLIKLVHELVEFQLTPHHPIASLVHPVVRSWQREAESVDSHAPPSAPSPHLISLSCCSLLIFSSGKVLSNSSRFL